MATTPEQRSLDRQRLEIRLREHEARLREFLTKAGEIVGTNRVELDAAMVDYEQAIGEFRERLEGLSPAASDLPRDAAAWFATRCDDLTRKARRVLMALC
jgi:hypothetical protein